MIRIRDAVTLARTKLKTRKIRTGITVGMSGILFGLMLAVSMAVAGISDSANRFSNQGLGGKYIMQAYPVMGNQIDWNEAVQDPKVQARAEEIHAKLIKDKQAEAKRLGIEYDPRSETEPVEKTADMKFLRTETSAGQQAISEYIATRPRLSDEKIIKDGLAPYKPTRYYQSRVMEVGGGKFVALKNGKEEFDKSKQGSNVADYNDIMSLSDNLGSAGLRLMDDELTDSFLLEDTKWTAAEGTIPVIITYSAAEKILGLKALSADASSKDRLARASDLRQKIAGHKVDYCYRNDTSRDKIDQTVLQMAEIKKNQGNKDYQMPSQIYGLPDASACGPAIVTKDTRTAEEERYDANQLAFDKKFTQVEEPRQAKISFQVVGLTLGYGNMLQRGMLQDIAMGMLGSSLGNEWVVPKSMYQQLSADKRYESIFMPTQTSYTFETLYATPYTYYAEFDNFASARAASKKYSCLVSSCTETKISLTQFGSSSVTVAEIKDLLRQAMIIAGIVVAGIAMIIMWGTIGRTIADSRRETAVFRAIGAKRRDISLIYLAYTILLSLRVLLFAIVLGLVVVVMIDYFAAADVSIDARLMFGVTDEAMRFSFVGVDLVELAAIAGLVLLTGLISMIVPLIRNVRRNPIGDMRDE